LFARVSISPLKSIKGNFIIDKSHFELRIASYTGLSEWDAPLGDALPLLNDSGTFVVPRGGCREIWLSVNTKRIPPGKYKGEIAIIPHYPYSASRKTVKLQLEVYPIKLPDEVPVIVETFPSYTARNAKIIPEENLGLIVEDLVKHGSNYLEILPEFLPLPVWKGEKMIAVAEKNSLARFNMLLNIYRKNNAKPFIYVFCNDRLAPFLQVKHFDDFEKWLKLVVNCLKEKGFGYNDFLMIFVDEIGRTSTSDYRAPSLKDYVRLHKFIRKIEPKIKIIQTVLKNSPLKEITSYVDIWCPVPSEIKDGNKFFELIKKDGKPCLCYNNFLSNKKCHPLIARKESWRAWKYKLSGFGFWGYNDLYCKPQDVRQSDAWVPWLTKDHGNIVYANNQWITEIVPSRRWEAFREGVEDYLYLWLLNKTIVFADARKIDATRGVALLKEFETCIYWNNDPNAIYQFRDKVAKEIIQINDKFPFKIDNPNIKINKTDLTVSFLTSEPTQAIIFYKKKELDRYWPTKWESIETKELSRSHAISLKNLEKGRKYTYFIIAINERGFVELNDNKGSNFSW
jgi:hypothetical protein